MIRGESVTVTDVTFAHAGDVLALDLWSGEPPLLDGVRALQVEPRRWWLFDARTRALDPGDGGALAPIGGGLVRATLTGGWRDTLMLAGWFDAEDPRFGPGDVAATIIHHVPVWIAPVAGERCEVYFPASYAWALIQLWGAS